MSAKELAISSAQLAAQAKRCAPLLKGNRIASYRAFDGEIDPRPIEELLIAQIYLPSILNLRRAEMHFYAKTNKCVISPLGISEPAITGQPIANHHLDVVLVPLVAFQRDGNRLGMGAGFYDRAFAFRYEQSALNRPVLIGLAHDFQETDGINTQPWDVPLDVIITNRELIIPQ